MIVFRSYELLVLFESFQFNVHAHVTTEGDFWMVLNNFNEPRNSIRGQRLVTDNFKQPRPICTDVVPIAH